MPRVLVVLGLLYPTHVTVWRAARELGVDVHVAGALDGPLVEPHQPAPRRFRGIPTHPLEVRGPSFLVERGLQWWWLDGLSRTVRTVRPDVVHVVSEVWGLMAVQALSSGLPTVIHSWDNLYRHGKPVEDVARLAVARRNLRHVAGHVCANARGLKLARTHGLPPERPAVVAPSVVPDPDPFLRTARERPDDGRVRIGFLGRLVPEKGLGWLIDAFATLDGEHVELHIYGDGPMRSRARNTGDARVHFQGPLSYERVPDVMASLDIVVVPSVSLPDWREQYGRVAVEAMLSGTPVIVSDSGALPEVVGPAGIIVREHDTAGLTRAMRELAASASLRRSLGSALQEHALDEHRPGAVAQRLTGLWKAVTA